MVGVIILYDHVHPQGAFVRSSNIDIKGSVKVLNDQPSEAVEGLLNALRYNHDKLKVKKMILICFVSCTGIQPNI